MESLGICFSRHRMLEKTLNCQNKARTEQTIDNTLIDVYK